ncbi:hypothetical protein G1H11_14180 [Phytoactinopolyspora alkaliphila]|uniref:Phage head morphogenesis domain-containing protein n=1 Tax=Phytoactinopolyspora alkaliphila TaxID=1783498 RepID=A0A6N9YN99_9ACTN|nr:hypothetical protein [Phytoactinopolyspora alkaliphila]NED96454.1 hypothetical protein [Phytoactinopolyspora alkaliphila]
MVNALTRRHETRQRQLRREADRQIRILWDELAGPTDQDAQSFIGAAVGVDLAARAQAVSMLDAYLAQLVTLQTREAVEILGLTPGVIRGGVPDTDVWMRSFVQARTARSRGAEWAGALRQGRDRARQTIATNVQLALQLGGRESMSRRTGVVGYRRVLGPGKNCDLCIVASTQRYHRGELMPIHPGCGCTVETITGTRDPGQVIDSQREFHFDDEFSDDVTRRAVERLGIEITDLPIVDIVHHGELGPVLWRHGEHFTSLDDIAA